MSDADEFARIAKASTSELLHYIVCNASFLTDPYYADFKRAIHKRYEELMAVGPMVVFKGDLICDNIDPTKCAGCLALADLAKARGVKW